MNTAAQLGFFAGYMNKTADLDTSPEDRPHTSGSQSQVEANAEADASPAPDGGGIQERMDAVRQHVTDNAPTYGGAAGGAAIGGGGSLAADKLRGVDPNYKRALILSLLGGAGGAAAGQMYQQSQVA